MKNTSSKLSSILASSAIAIGTAMPAFSNPPETNVGEQTGTGKTTLKLIVDGAEYGGTEISNSEDPSYNPDTDRTPDGIGNNLAFSAPTELDFVVKANGDMLCPSASATAIHNASVCGIHVSSVDIDAPSGWNLVTDANFAAATSSNTVSMNKGPATDDTKKIAIASYLDKTTLTNGLTKWGMDAVGADQNKDKLYLSFDGKAKNLNTGYDAFTSFAEIHWYLTAGGEGIRYIEPSRRGMISRNAAGPVNGNFTVRSSVAGDDEWSYAAEGDTMYIVAEPEDGYVVDDMDVKKISNDSEVTVTRDVQDENIGTFTMPDEAVSVSVSFKEDMVEPTLPAASNFASTNVATFKSIGDYLRSGSADATFINAANDLVGQTVTVTLANTNSAIARLVDVSTVRGLVFQFDFTSPIESAKMNSSATNLGGWTASALRTSLNSATDASSIYATKLQGMTINGDVVDPVAISSSSPLTSLDYNEGSPQVIMTSGDKFWLPSVAEIYEPTAWAIFKALADKNPQTSARTMTLSE